MQILHHNSNMAFIQCQFSFRRPLPNDFKFELDVVCKVILILKCILKMRKTSRHTKIEIMEGYLQILHYIMNNAWIQSQFSFRRRLTNDFRFKLDVVCKVILIFKDNLRLRNKSKHIKKGIMKIEGIYLNLITSGPTAKCAGQ